jgi:hypothetical protein
MTSNRMNTHEISDSLTCLKVCDAPVAKQNFYQRHGHDLIQTIRKKRKIDEEDADLFELSSCLSRLPPVDGKELSCFFDWIQDSEDIF